MDPEQQRKLSSILLDAMQAKNITFEKLAAVTNISERFLEPLFVDDFSRLPALPYLHGYIAKIGTVLGLDGEEIWKAYFEENPAIKRSGKSDELPKNRFKKIKIDRRLIAGVIAGAVFLIFVVWRIQAYFGPPALALQDFSDNMAVEAKEYIIKGNVDPQNQLFLNGEQIYPSPNGDFEKTIELQPGFNALSFRIKKFLGKEYTVEKEIFWKTAETPVPRKQALETAPQGEENVGTTTTSTAE